MESMMRTTVESNGMGLDTEISVAFEKFSDGTASTESLYEDRSPSKTPPLPINGSLFGFSNG